VVLASTGAEAPVRLEPVKAVAAPAPRGQRRIVDARLGRPITVPVYERTALEPGAALKGPALVVEADTSTYVSPSFDFEVDAGGALVLSVKTREVR
jgi:N-methylhydantoinase A